MKTTIRIAIGHHETHHLYHWVSACRLDFTPKGHFKALGMSWSWVLTHQNSGQRMDGTLKVVAGERMRLFPRYANTGVGIDVPFWGF